MKREPITGPRYQEQQETLSEIASKFGEVAYRPDSHRAVGDKNTVLSYLKEDEVHKKNNGRGVIRSNGDVFVLVDSVLPGYSIWNIGKHMVDGYLPICRLKAVQPFSGGREIETETLRAIRCDGAQVILAAVGYGPETPEEMEKYIAKHSETDQHATAVQRMKEALPYMRQIKWN